MRVAYVFTDLPSQKGIFSHAEVLALAERGVDVEIYCLRSRLTDNPATEELRASFPVHRAGYLSPSCLMAVLWALFTRPRVVARGLWRAVADTASSPPVLVKTLAIFPKCCLFARQIADSPTDWIQAYWSSLPGRAAWWISELSGVPYGTWAHAGADIYNRSLQTPAALKTTLTGASMVLTCNRYNLEHFDRTLPADVRSRVVYHAHGIDTDLFSPDDAMTEPAAGAPLKLLSVGQLKDAKGFDVSVQACRRLLDQGVPVHYRLVGEGPERPRLESMIQELELGGSVELVGALGHEELRHEYRSADVFVLPSRIGKHGSRDGLPNVLLEAMASGVASVGSEAVGIPEAIEDGVTGVLFPPDDTEALADAIANRLSDPERRREMGRAARRLVLEQFRRPDCMDRLATILREASAAAADRSAGDVPRPAGQADSVQR